MNTEHRKYFIKEFIKENGRAPSYDEVDKLLLDKRSEYLELENFGVSSLENKFLSFGKEASKIEEEKLRLRNLTDLKCSMKTIDEAKEELILQKMKSHSVLDALKRKLYRVEKEIDYSLLSLNNVDQFVSYIVETFDGADHVDARSTISVKDGFCTIGTTTASLSNKNTDISFSSSSSANILATNIYGSFEALTEKSEPLQIDIVTNQDNALVTWIIDFTFQKKQLVQELFLELGVIAMSGSFFFSTYGKKDSVVFPIEINRAITKKANTIQIGETVDGLRLVFQKRGFDTKTVTSGQFAYELLINKLLLKEASGTYLDEAELYWEGSFNSPFYGTMQGTKPSLVRLDTCVVEPEGSSIRWFVSYEYDGPWRDIFSWEKYHSVVNLENLELNINEDVFNVEYGATALLKANENFPSYSGYLMCNTICTNTREAVPESFVVKRNCRESQRTTPDDINNVPRGWYYDTRTSIYSTTIYLTNTKVIDLGSSSAWLNGRLVNGKVTLQPGYSQFKTKATNFYSIPELLPTEVSLRAVDNLYPFNHRYLIEGYEYPLVFSGFKVYTGVEENFGRLLTQVDSDELDSENEFALVTIPDNLDGAFAIIKQKADDAYWDKEICKMTWRSRMQGESNSIWVKAILTRNLKGQAPSIDWFALRGL